jgi:hypothetical protein
MCVAYQQNRSDESAKLSYTRPRMIIIGLASLKIVVTYLLHYYYSLNNTLTADILSPDTLNLHSNTL